MPVKQQWYKTINWAGVGKGVVYVLSALGLALGVSSTSGVVSGNADSDVQGRLNLHVVSDSLRSVYIEKQLVSIESQVQILARTSQETRDAVIRLEARK